MQFIVITHFPISDSIAYRVSAEDATTAENLVWDYFRNEEAILQQETRPATVPLSLEDANIPKLPGN